jgi:nitrite reductase/ring-hydroxylating ferredoxin subunit
MTTPNPQETWHEVAELRALDPDFPFGVELNGTPIGIYLHNGEPCAVEDTCPHAYALLSQGYVQDGIVECPLHSAQFEVATGKCLNEIGQRDLRVFPIRVVDGKVQVRLDE